MNHTSEVAKLAYQLTYHKYLLNKDTAQNLFTELTVPEYIALHSITRVSSDRETEPEKTYLKDLSEQLGMPIHSVSAMAGKLKERGLVIWSHAGDGSEGTYLIITDSGLRAMGRQEEILNEYYGRVIEKFGRDRLIRLLAEMEQLEHIMNKEFAGKGDTAYGSDSVE